MKKILYIAIIAIPALLLFNFCVSAQSTNPAENKRIVESQNYIFVAETATPLQGQLIRLDGGYELTVSREQVKSYLPYYGRAFTTPADPAETGLKFTSKEFRYVISQKKADEWEVLITPVDYPDVKQIQLSIFDNGTAVLQVISLNKEPMSYRGHILSGGTN